MIPGMKNQAGKVKAIIDSSSEARIGWAKVAILLVAVSVAFSAGKHVWYRQTGDPIFGISTARGQSVEVLPTATAQAIATSTSTLEATQEAYVETVFKEIVVTATPTPVPPTPEVIYINVPYEVERVVTNTITIVDPTATPIPLAGGSVEICVRVEGAREIYVGGSGVVSGGCEIFAFGVGQTSIQVQVNK